MIFLVVLGFFWHQTAPISENNLTTSISGSKFQHGPQKINIWPQKLHCVTAAPLIIHLKVYDTYILAIFFTQGQRKGFKII